MSGWLKHHSGHITRGHYVVKRYNIAVESVQKETASLHKRDCRARATHPSAVDYMVVKQSGFGKWLRRSKK